MAVIEFTQYRDQNYYDGYIRNTIVHIVVQKTNYGIWKAHIEGLLDSNELEQVLNKIKELENK